MKGKEVFLSVLVAVGIGILTNAIWDFLRPFFRNLFRFILDVSILGIENFKDDIYLEIAKGFHEGVSLSIFILLLAALAVFIVWLILVSIFLQRRIVDRDGETFLGKSLFSLRMLALRRSFVWFILVYMIFALTIFILDITKYTYINDAITNYKQLSRIVQPYISLEKVIEYDSTFAQIENKQDYENIIVELQKIAKENEQKVPEFDFIF